MIAAVLAAAGQRWHPQWRSDSGGSGSDGSNGAAQWSSAARGSILADSSSAMT
jgi:hypothetical protein